MRPLVARDRVPLKPGKPRVDDHQGPVQPRQDARGGAHPAAGETQDQVTRALNIDRTTYCKIEKGSLDPSLSLAMRIASFFHATVEELFSDAASAVREAC